MQLELRSEYTTRGWGVPRRTVTVQCRTHVPVPRRWGFLAGTMQVNCRAVVATGTAAFIQALSCELYYKLGYPSGNNMRAGKKNDLNLKHGGIVSSSTEGHVHS